MAEAFPEVDTHATVAERDAHPAYVAATSGDVDATFDLAGDIVDVARVRDVQRWIVPGTRLLPVSWLRQQSKHVAAVSHRRLRKFDDRPI
ncbi:hypothetical protein [uncultured Sphingomonas sp.]|uniref:hypothetical protein n=1 Tax=uncultured Sphingomonas sp. TaxID=158754 RepID=UPI0025CC9059|nr:hypothetical protein [uncultured Sphingomonas sp.]